MDIKKENVYTVKLNQEDAEAFAEGLEALLEKGYRNLDDLYIEELYVAFCEAIGK